MNKFELQVVKLLRAFDKIEDKEEFIETIETVWSSCTEENKRNIKIYIENEYIKTDISNQELREIKLNRLNG